MNVFWTDTAVSHLTAIHAYISRDSATYAQRVVDRPHPPLGTNRCLSTFRSNGA